MTQDSTQGGLWDVIIENDALADLLEKRAQDKEAQGRYLSANRKIMKIIAEGPQFKENSGKRVRVGGYAFDVLDDPGGIERPVSVSKSGVKARKFTALED